MLFSCLKQDAVRVASAFGFRLQTPFSNSTPPASPVSEATRSRRGRDQRVADISYTLRNLCHPDR
jgi:hypothetical protein